jgi:hypothetical protein
MPSLVVTLLAERSPAELENLHGSLRAELTRLDVEMRQVEEAIALQGRQSRSRRPRSTTTGHRRPGKPSNTRQRIHDIFAAATEAIGQAYVKREMAKQDEPMPKGGSIYSMMARMTEEGELVKISHGLYMLVDRVGTDATDHGPTENGASASLSRGPLAPQEG